MGFYGDVMQRVREDHGLKYWQHRSTVDTNRSGWDNMLRRGGAHNKCHSQTPSKRRTDGRTDEETRQGRPSYGGTNRDAS